MWGVERPKTTHFHADTYSTVSTSLSIQCGGNCQFNAEATAIEIFNGKEEHGASPLLPVALMLYPRL